MRSQKSTHLYLQVFVVGAGQTLESHHESCTLKYRNTNSRLGLRTYTYVRTYKEMDIIANQQADTITKSVLKVRAGYLAVKKQSFESC